MRNYFPLVQSDLQFLVSWYFDKNWSLCHLWVNQHKCQCRRVKNADMKCCHKDTVTKCQQGMTLPRLNESLRNNSSRQEFFIYILTHAFLRPCYSFFVVLHDTCYVVAHFSLYSAAKEFIRGKAMSGEPSIRGTSQLPNPPIKIGFS